MNRDQISKLFISYSLSLDLINVVVLQIIIKLCNSTVCLDWFLFSIFLVKRSIAFLDFYLEVGLKRLNFLAF